MANLPFNGLANAVAFLKKNFMCWLVMRLFKMYDYCQEGSRQVRLMASSSQPWWLRTSSVNGWQSRARFNLQSSQSLSGPFPLICASRQSCRLTISFFFFFLLHACFVVCPALSTVGPYIGRCVPFQRLGYTKWNCKNLSSILNFMAKAVHTYLFFIFW